MCMSKPKIPPPPPPPPPPSQQEIKQPNSGAVLRDRARRNRRGMAGGSLLTGPSGVSQGALTTGKTTLLGQ